MLKKIMQSLMVLTLAAGVTASTFDQAEARRGRGIGIGIAAGIIGLGILGAYANARDRYDYGRYGAYDDYDGCRPGPERCGWTKRRCFENSWGDYVCRGGRYRCWRENYCD
jgi:hypothetical protein